MSKPEITRRVFVRLSAAGAVALGAATATGCKADDQSSKTSKKIAGYIEKKQISTESCASCHFFIDPNDCVVVDGPISPHGYCTYFTN